MNIFNYIMLSVTFTSVEEKANRQPTMNSFLAT